MPIIYFSQLDNFFLVPETNIVGNLTSWARVTHPIFSKISSPVANLQSQNYVTQSAFLRLLAGLSFAQPGQRANPTILIRPDNCFTESEEIEP